MKPSAVCLANTKIYPLLAIGSSAIDLGLDFLRCNHLDERLRMSQSKKALS